MASVKIQEAALIMVAFQNEYLHGALALPGARHAIRAAKRLLALARQARCPVLHIAHRGGTGRCFDRDGERGQFVRGLGPRAGEITIETASPGALPAAALPGRLAGSGARSVIVAGFMTDVCVSATAQAARHLEYRVTVVASACATRGLPGVFGGGVDASMLQAAALAELAAQNVDITRGCDALM
jgi:nicotinamidase-related amidase